MKTFKLFGVVVNDKGERWSDDDVAPSQFKNFLAGLKDNEPFELSINSPGGSVTAGLAIANMVRDYAGEVTAKIYGMAASMASVVAAACDRLIMFDQGYFMMHNPWGISMGESKDLRGHADLLDSMKAQLVAIYGNAFDKTPEEIAALMDASTWIGGGEAATYGLKADLFSEPLEMAASIAPFNLENVPEGARKFYTFAKTEETKPDAEEEGDGVEPDAGREGEDEGDVEPDGDASDGISTEPDDAYLALVDRLESTEQQRRDYQSKADKLQAQLAEAQAKITDLESRHAAQVASMESQLKTYKDRINSMALNALAAPDQSCAQDWPEALAECGGKYELAAKKYPHLAEAYRQKARKV